MHADLPVKLFADASLRLVNRPPVQTVMGRTGSGQIVAVIDSGVDCSQAAYGPCSAPGVGSGCEVVASCYTATNTATPPVGDTLDTIGHGTKVSTVALSVAPGARIAALGVFTECASNSSDVIEAINWAIANRVADNIVAVNLSLGDGINHTDNCAGNVLATPVNSARNAGTVVVAATGNDAFTTGIAAPAWVSAAVAVGAVYSANWGGLTWSGCTDASTVADQVVCFSNSGALLDLLVPGALFNFNGSNTGGTSVAAPMVAGAVAVLNAQFPAETVRQIEARLLNTAVVAYTGTPLAALVNVQGGTGSVGVDVNAGTP